MRIHDVFFFVFEQYAPFQGNMSSTFTRVSQQNRLDFRTSGVSHQFLHWTGYPSPSPLIFLLATINIKHLPIFKYIIKHILNVFIYFWPKHPKHPNIMSPYCFCFFSILLQEPRTCHVHAKGHAAHSRRGEPLWGHRTGCKGLPKRWRSAKMEI